MKYNPRDENSIKAVMAKANVVINLIGREYGTRNYSLEEVNRHMAAQLAKISKEHGGIMTFIQLSCLGASKSSPSRLLQTQAAAEESILNELPEATILRPAVMLGTEDRILNPWAQFARKYNFLPLVSGGSTKIQPVYVADVASTVVAALKDDGSSMGKLYELGYILLMMMTTEVTYRSQPGAEGLAKDSNIVAVVTMGFVKDAKAHIDVQGYNVYHKN